MAPESVRSGRCRRVFVSAATRRRLPQVTQPPSQFVDIGPWHGIQLEIGYARADNFTGMVLPGYGRAGAWLHDAAARSLREVLQSLRRRGLGLIVYDAYRPQRAVDAMVRWCEDHQRQDLLAGWVGRTSRHARGTAIDVGLTWLDSGAPLPMGGSWDVFDARSHFEGATGASRANRRALRDAMARHGFRPYWREWWHFERPVDPLPPCLDVPYSG